MEGEEEVGIPAVPVEDDRIPCAECGKMLPKNAMKRHMMKHEVDNLGMKLNKTLNCPASF